MKAALIMKEQHDLLLSSHQHWFHSFQLWPFIMNHPPLELKHSRQKFLLPVEDNICAVVAIFVNTFLDKGVCPANPDQPVLSCSQTDGLLWSDAELRKDDRIDMVSESARGDLSSGKVIQEVQDSLLDMLITEPGPCCPRATSCFFW